MTYVLSQELVAVEEYHDLSCLQYLILVLNSAASFEGIVLKMKMLSVKIQTKLVSQKAI